MPTRPQLFQIVCNLVGAAQCTAMSPGTGWPGIAEIVLANGSVTRVALHVSQVGSHSRQAYEMRFQNPADRSPVTNPGGAIPVLIGLAYVGVQPILVAVDGASRLNRAARFSVLFRSDILNSAALRGWAEYQSSTGEHIVALHPKLLGIFIDAVTAGIFPDSQEVIHASAASGVVQDNTEEAAERARAVASRLVRDARFSKDVRNAYNERCAMCGLSLGLIVGAHIFPASAPQSQDKVWNGLALCHNHHAAFDRHYIWIDPQNSNLRLRPDILNVAQNDAAARTFAQNTRPSIVAPTIPAHRPRPAMFVQRYAYYEDQYNWV